MNKLIGTLVVLTLGFGAVAEAQEEDSSPIAPQSFDGFGGDPQLAFAPAPGELPGILVAAGPKPPPKAARSKTKGKWVSAEDLKLKRARKSAAHPPKKKSVQVAKAVKPKKPLTKVTKKTVTKTTTRTVARAKALAKGRKVASVTKKSKKAK